MAKVWCYIENTEKEAAVCKAEGCWGGPAFLAECIGRWRPNMPELRRVPLSSVPVWNTKTVVAEDWTPDNEGVWHLINPHVERDYPVSYCEQAFYWDEQGELELRPKPKGSRCHLCLRLAPKE